MVITCPRLPATVCRLEIGLSGRLGRRASAQADAEPAVGAGRPKACSPKRATSVGNG